MATPLDTPIALTMGSRYVAKSYHRDSMKNGRNTSRNKSQWTIYPVDEVACFVDAISEGWSDDLEAWGLHIAHAVPADLGITTRDDISRVARFRNAGLYWSGFPADYRNELRDRPPTIILQRWSQANLIEKYEIARIRSGRRCSLSN